MEKQRTHEEYFIGIRHRDNCEELKARKAWQNAMNYYPGHKSTFAKTEQEARDVLAYAYKLWNGEKAYDAEGKRYETSAVGPFGVTMVSDKKIDDDLRIVEHVIRKRIVTDWEVIEK